MATTDFNLSIGDESVTIDGLQLDIEGFEGTVEELVSEVYRRVKSDRSESTANRYISNIVRWLTWCDDVEIHPLDARSGELKTNLREMHEDGYAKDSLKVRRASVSMLYNQCDEIATDRTASVDIDPDVIADNPSEELDLTKWDPINQDTKKSQVQKKDVTPLEPDEIEQLCDNVPSPELRNELIIRLLYQTGLRQEELAKIEISDINRNERSISIHADKTEHNRTVYYRPQPTNLLLNRWIDSGNRDSIPGADESNYLFPSPSKDQINGNYINQIVIKAAENAGIQEILYVDKAGRERVKITAHALRHSFAAHSVKNGMDIKNLQTILGHKNLETTETYLQFREEEVRDAARKYGAGGINNAEWEGS